MQRPHVDLIEGIVKILQMKIMIVVFDRTTSLSDFSTMLIKQFLHNGEFMLSGEVQCVFYHI